MRTAGARGTSDRPDRCAVSSPQADPHQRPIERRFVSRVTRQPPFYMCASWFGRSESTPIGWPPPTWASFRPAGWGGATPHRLHTLQPDITTLACARGALRTTGGEMLLTDGSVQSAGCRSDRGQRRPQQLHTGEPGTELALPAGESVRSPQPVRSACAVGLRPGGGRCWMCGQAGRADPPATAYFCCDGCDVRWYGGTRHLRHGNPAFKQREFTWWTASRLARARYIDHTAEHTPSPA
jgi:hypothetical protein